MIEILPESDGPLIALALSGKLTHEDFEPVTPELDERIAAAGGTIRLLLDLRAFEGWDDLRAMWDHFRLVKDHHRAVERIALVGDAAWERRLAELADRFALAEVGVYASDRFDEALAWLRRRDED